MESIKTYRALTIITCLASMNMHVAHSASRQPTVQERADRLQNIGSLLKDMALALKKKDAVSLEEILKKIETQLQSDRWTKLKEGLRYVTQEGGELFSTDFAQKQQQEAKPEVSKQEKSYKMVVTYGPKQPASVGARPSSQTTQLLLDLNSYPTFDALKTAIMSQLAPKFKTPKALELYRVVKKEGRPLPKIQITELEELKESLENGEVGAYDGNAIEFIKQFVGRAAQG